MIKIERDNNTIKFDISDSTEFEVEIIYKLIALLKAFEFENQLGSKEELKMSKSAKHPGFKSVQNKIAEKEGVSKKAAGAILAKSTRGASKAAKKKNPKLKKVK